VRFLVDAQLPPALARLLSRNGHEASYVFEEGLASAPDSDIWTYAMSRGAALITKDEDFVAIRAFATGGPAIIWVQVGNVTNRRLLPYFHSMLPMTLASIKRGESVIVLSDN
jgi:predicted nuclease of predicted toxin-antitoxin system